MKTKNTSLISIIIITYNSSRYVLETLDSLKKQNYKNIELIISDDGSKDNTLELCENWTNKNFSLFNRVKIISSSINTGIPANCNRGINAAKGDWIKIIAGDDIFLNNAMLNFVNTIASTDRDYDIIQTNSKAYLNTFKKENYLYDWSIENNLKFFKLKSSDQYKMLKYHYFLNTPAIFIKRNILDKFKFIEDFKKIEDYPFFINVTSGGVKIDYLPIDTVGYRVHNNSVQKINNKPYQSSESLFQKKNILERFYKNVSNSYPIYLIKIYIKLDNLGFNNRTLFSKFIYIILQKLDNIIIKLNILLLKKE